MSQALKSHYSVFIIGAGINGCGTFRDLSMQGVDCLIIDKGDVCGGTSAASSRLMHGGIKYLETGEFRLVKESAMERNRLLRNAPHYVKPIEVILPVKSTFGGIIPAAKRFLGVETKINDRGSLITRIGLMIYDAYNRKVKALPDHSYFGQAELKQKHKGLEASITGAGMYYEGQLSHAERLCLEVVMDGITANPGSALRTYTTAKPQNGAFILKDEITGETATITADVIINAGGPWIDKVNDNLGKPTEHMGGSKGSHLVVSHPELNAAINGRMFFFGTPDGRLNLIYPFFGNALIGTTDLAIKDPDQARSEEIDIDYLLAVSQAVFPHIKLTRDHLLLTYCGVRPLPRSEGKDIGVVTRDHAIAEDTVAGITRPVLSLIGGKWTTFRAFSEQATDKVLGLLEKTRRTSTAEAAIGGGRNYPKDGTAYARNLAKTTGVNEAQSASLFARYGTTAESFATAIGKTDKPLASLPSYTMGEISHICRSENVRRLSDILLRRTVISFEGKLAVETVKEVASIAAKTLGWDAARTTEEIALMLEEMRKRKIRA